jgi:hypothetical protein
MPSGINAAAMETTRLNRVPVTVTGDWYPRPRRWQWQGIAQAPVPLIGIILCEQSGMVRWARSDHRASEAGLPLLMDVPHEDSRTWIYAGVGRASGRGLVQATTVTATERPTVLCHTTTTAEVTPLANLSGEPPVTLSLLLLIRSDVRSRRLGLWGVRPVLLGDVEEPWRTVLQYGRTGSFRI